MRFLLIILYVVLLSGCVPASMILKTRNIQEVDAGFVADSEADQLLSTDLEVDQLSKDIIRVLTESGFELRYESVSFGLVPATGHTQNVTFTLKDNIHIQAYVEISKASIKANFEEVEAEHGSNYYKTSTSDRKAVHLACSSVGELVKKKIGKRSIRYIFYENPAQP